ncbi:hypothetical protein [Vibrio sonorensis]|uniref:hypothetical protein n=1 Tax=Vibrio sonorensis TaxID=1004316 RepID=UPI0008D92EF0|nr:hypothetical protein [Vibrio sonorensis]
MHIIYEPKMVTHSVPFLACPFVIAFFETGEPVALIMAIGMLWGLASHSMRFLIRKDPWYQKRAGLLLVTSTVLCFILPIPLVMALIILPSIVLTYKALMRLEQLGYKR